MLDYNRVARRWVEYFIFVRWSGLSSCCGKKTSFPPARHFWRWDWRDWFLLVSSDPARFPRKRTADDLTVRTVTADHWRYGKWAVASAVVAWFPDNIYYAVLPAFSGLGATAALRALINLINPVLHVLYALSAVLIPTLVRHRERAGTAGMTRTMKTLLGLLFPVSIVYMAMLWWFRLALFQAFYGGNYREYSGRRFFWWA